MPDNSAAPEPAAPESVPVHAARELDHDHRTELVDGKLVVGIPSTWSPVMRHQWVESKRNGPHVVLWLKDGCRWVLPVIGESFGGKTYQWRIQIPVGVMDMVPVPKKLPASVETD